MPRASGRINGAGGTARVSNGPPPDPDSRATGAAAATTPPQTTPWSIIESATLMKPAMLAPLT